MKIYHLTLDLGVKVTQTAAQYPLHYVIYAPAKFEVNTAKIFEEMHIQENILFDF